MAVSSAVRGRALSVAGGYCVLAYLHWRGSLTPLEVGLVEGIMFRPCLDQSRRVDSSGEDDSAASGAEVAVRAPMHRLV